MNDVHGFLARFPALTKLGVVARPWQVPVVLQLSATDCGAACLAMVLGFHGREVRFEEIRQAMDIGRDGVSALAILDTAALFGLRGRGVKVPLEELAELPAGTILHWNLAHFVVFERVVDSGIEIVDPSIGRRVVSVEEVDASFTGVALLLEKGEHFVRARSKDKPVVRYLKRAVKDSKQLPKILLASGLLQVFGIALPLINGRVVDRVLPRNDGHLLAVLVMGLFMTLGFSFLTSMVRNHLLLNLRTQLDVTMTLNFFDHMLRLPYAFFQRRQTGDLLMRVNSNATIREMLTSSVMSGTIDGCMVVLYLVVLLVTSPIMALAAAAIVVSQSAFFLLTRKKQLELAAGSITKKSTSESYLIEMLEGVETLKACGLENRAVEQWSSKYVDVMNIAIRRGEFGSWCDSILGTLRTAGPFLLLLLGTSQVMEGKMSLGTMLSAQAFAVGFIGPMSGLVETFMQLQVAQSYLARVDEIFATPIEQAERPDLRPAPVLRGDVALEHVSFRYGTRAPLVVSDVSLRVSAGQMVAVVGRSGSGKSTLAALLLRLLVPSSGRVLVGGCDLSDIDVRGVRRQIGMVPQKPYVFGTTLRANIAFAAPETTHAEIENAARLACIHDDIAAMPLGYDTLLTAGGASLSGGQRQRIALARALLQRPAILLLDEATSALDAMTERQVLANLEKWPCTRIVVAHRLSTIVRADMIVVMDQGRIVETGTHAELLARNGQYTALVRAQLGESTEAPRSAPARSGESPKVARPMHVVRAVGGGR